MGSRSGAGGGQVVGVGTPQKIAANPEVQVGRHSQGGFWESKLEGKVENYNTPVLLNMGAHMKTTIEVSDALFSSAKELAQKRQTTLRALVEEGLRRVLSDSSAKAKPAFRLKDASVRGRQMLVADPGRWHQMEDEHVIARVIKGRP